jgi:electron transfer flavoprotein beta subunit
MDIVVLLKQVPDLVEELEIAPSGQFIDRERMRFAVSEADSHALEEAIVLKERHGGTVTAVGLDIGDVNDALFTAIARGADRAIKITGDFPEFLESHHVALVAADVLKGLKYDLVLSGAQAIDDLDGQPLALLAGHLGLPYVSVVNRVVPGTGQVTVAKELPGSVAMELDVRLPAALGIQSAEEPPRYVPVSKIRQVMRSATMEERPAGATFKSTIAIRRIRRPEPSRRAVMVEGGPDAVARFFAQLVEKRGILH